MVSIAGRMMRKRSSGKAGFADFVDRTGKIQVYARKDMVGDEQYHIFKRADLGDFMGIKGDVI
ncbi:OB-fold nucleic acid binding domain-containing protein, partial [Agathobacter rectalis]|uniref:OB-fold nucleic acid binding domain-containing protein n=2 Tax=Bacillota TaxID=1239 RepID=UPI0027F411DF|nr:lysine--tRNA ligase [Agathobacter rectalis]